MKRLIFTFISFLCFAVPAWSQEIVEVTGVVVDANDRPIAGVSIFVTDAPGLGTVTNNEGRYRMRVERYKKLTLSHVGYDRQEVLIKDDFVIDVTLQEAESSILDEVVVTGTGAQTRLTLTGAVTTVNVDDLKSNPTSSLSNALAGNVP